MNIELEDDDGELKHILETLSDNMSFEDGEDATPEDVAVALLRESASKQYQQLVAEQVI